MPAHRATTRAVASRPLRAREYSSSGLPPLEGLERAPGLPFRRVCRTLGLFIQPDVFHAKVVDDAVDHHRPVLDPRLPAIGEAVEKDDRPRPVLGQLLFDLPHQLLALPLIGFDRLPLELFFELGVAIAGVVAWRTAAIALVKLLVRVVDAAASEIEPDLKVLAVHLGVPKGSFDDL